MVEFTYDQFIAAMETVVDRQGRDFVYTTPTAVEPGSGICYYNPKNDPKGRDTGCIVGETIRELTGAYPEDRREGAKAVLLFSPNYDDRVSRAAQVAQDVQDIGGSWGRALDRAKSLQDYL